MARLGAFNLALLICLDQLLQTLFVGLWWLLTGRGKCPDPDETLSSYAGRGAQRGRIWGHVASLFIDTLFFLLTGQRKHCAASIEVPNVPTI